MSRRILTLPLLVVALCLVAGPREAVGGPDCAVQRSIGAKLALTGLDPVLLVSGKQEPGRENLRVDHGGFAYLFAGEDSKRVFEENPDRYGVQLQGFCPVSPDLPGKSDIYLVHEGRIYLFYSQPCREAFQSDPGRFRPI